MTSQVPVVDIKVRLAAQEIAAAFLLQKHEVAAHVQAGVDEATETIGLLIKEEARKCAIQAITNSVSMYFKYGDGHKAIDLAVRKALNDIINTDFGENKSGE